MQTEPQQIPTSKALFLVFMLMLFGAVNTIGTDCSYSVLKLQNIQLIEGGHLFFHPTMQGCGLFFG